MAAIDDLRSAKDNMAANLLAITANPKPSYSIDGQSVSWSEYHKMLLEGITSISLLIEQNDPQQSTTYGASA